MFPGAYVTRSTLLCRTCGGSGVCPCPRDVANSKHAGGTWCDARWAERQRREPVTILYGLPVAYHDGLTCHTCFGSGTPVQGRWSYDPRRSPTRTSDFGRLRRAIIEDHLWTTGPVCPGVDRAAHEVPSSELVVDHIVPLARGGAALDPANLRVLCRDCNVRKSARFAKPQD